MDAVPLLVADIHNLDQLLDEIENAVMDRRPTIFIGIYPSLSLVYRSSAQYRAALATSRTYPDGTGVTLSMRALGHGRLGRVPTTDAIWPILEMAQERRWRVLMYGAAPGVARRAAAAMQERHPGLELVGIYDGFCELGGDELAAIAPDVVLVARGAPLQEIWAQMVAVPASVPVVLTCGGLFDFLSSGTARAPLWLQRAGLEWVFRILQEPRRLAGRYVLGNSLFVWWMLSVFIRRRQQAVTRGSS